MGAFSLIVVINLLNRGKMPNLRIETNVPADSIKDLNTCLRELSKAVASSTGKPEQYVMVQIVPGIPMMFGGSDLPCASAFFSSIGCIGPEENKAHAAAVYPLVAKHLGVPKEQMYILFHNASYQDMAWKGTTFAQLLGK